MTRVVLVFAPVAADNLVDVQELFIVDADLQSLDVGCKHPMEIQVVGNGLAHEHENQSFVVI